MKKLVLDNRADVIGLCTALALMLLVVVGQQLLPSDKPLPYAQFNGKFQSIKNTEQITGVYGSVIDEKVTVNAGEQAYTYRVGDLGISLNQKKSLADFYPENRLKRLIPFSTLVQAKRTKIPFYSSNKKGLRIVATDIASKARVDSVNSSLKVVDGALLATPSKEGTAVDPKVVENFILDAVSRRQSTVTLGLKKVAPAVTEEELTGAIKAFTATLPSEITVSAGQTTTTLPKSDILSWAKVDQTTDTLIAFDQTKVNDYALRLAEQNFSSQAATPTIVLIEDGKEISRTIGLPGKSVDALALAGSILQAVKFNKKSITAVLVDAMSPISYRRSYTRSSQGLQDLLSQLTKDRRIGIRYIDTNDRGWDVSSGAATEYQMASTYKLFVAYSVLRRIESGEMKWADTIGESDISTCFDLMIIESDNACALAFAELVGWSNIAREGKAIGATGLNWIDEVNATPNDVAVLLQRLASSSILTESSRSRLFGAMKAQVYRQGIPAGTPYEVADKVGFQDDGLHDGAIIYAPNLTHVLVIFTNDSNWQEIAEITAQIEALAT